MKEAAEGTGVGRRGAGGGVVPLVSPLAACSPTTELFPTGAEVTPEALEGDEVQAPNCIILQFDQAITNFTAEKENGNDRDKFNSSIP